MIIALIAFGIFASPFVSDQSDLPKGWELPKVYFWQVLSSSLIAIILISRMLKKIRSKDFTLNKLHLVFVSLLFFYLLISLGFKLTRGTEISSENNPLYLTILPILYGVNESHLVKISVFGNTFRETGFITIALLLSLFWLCKDYLSLKNWHSFLYAFIASSVTQSLLALMQIFDLNNQSFDLVTEGKWVYGSFGQTNFYVGHLLVGLVSSLYFLRTKFVEYSIFPIIFITIGILISFSYWGYAVLATIFILTLIYEKSNPFFLKIFSKQKYLVAFVTFGLFPIIYIATFILYPSEFRLTIWDAVIDTHVIKYFRDPFDLNQLKIFLFGSGFDSLGKYLGENNKFLGMNIDRPHNIFLFILTSSGTFGLVIFSWFFIRVTKLTEDLVQNRAFIYSLFLLLAWILRSQLHTSTIVNLVDFFAILTLVYANRRFRQYK